MGIREVSDRSIRKNRVSYVNSNFAIAYDYLKLINFGMDVVKSKGKFNRMGVATPDTSLSIGDMVTIDEGVYIIGGKTPDIYKGAVTRYVCELFFCDVTCNITRRTLQKDTYGTIIGSSDVLVHEDIPVSWQVSDLFTKGDRDQNTEYYNAGISIHHFNSDPVLKEDVVTYFGSEYEAKFFRRDTPGIVLVRVEPVTA